MAKIPAARAAAMFEEMIGWPYASPGSNDARGIDCSGAWVRVYQAFDKRIDHGSNSQYRRFCAHTGPIDGTTDLQTGMAVFKVREWSASDAGHRDYGSPPGNLYHVGCVTGVNPLRIVHATPDAAKADTTLGSWRYWGMLREVLYGRFEFTDSSIDIEQVLIPTPKTACGRYRTTPPGIRRMWSIPLTTTALATRPP